MALLTAAPAGKLNPPSSFIALPPARMRRPSVMLHRGGRTFAEATRAARARASRGRLAITLSAGAAYGTVPIGVRRDAVDFELRDATLTDLGHCRNLLSSPLLCDPSEYAALSGFWSELIRSRAGIACIAADGKAPAPVVHFAFGVFVSDERIAKYRRCLTPFVARRVVAEWASGGHPFLRLPEIARANAEHGLDLLITHYGHRRGDPRVHIANYESSRRALGGWNLRSFTVEYFADPQRDDRAWARSLGYRILEYSPDRVREAGIPAERAPFLLTAARSDVPGNPAYGPALLFAAFSPPRFGLNAREQQLLAVALEGGTDLSIARALGISESSVKKHFRTIYEKAFATGAVDKVAPGSASDKRGAEARRHLLNYLREHPEELRPYNKHR